MEKERERRYQTAEELLSDLGNIEEGLPLGTKLQPRRKSFIATLIRKKLSIPAMVVALIIIAFITWQIFPQKGVVPSEQAKPSIAVLPFEDLSPQKDQQYFCDGLAETLINALTNIKDLKVPARTSVFLFKDKEVDIREIGKKLNVDKILEGSVQIEGKRLRITAQLINVEDGYHLWSEKYDRDRQDIFAIQDEISLAIVDKLKLKILGEERARLVKRHTESHEAYNLYLEGKYFLDKLDLQKALMSFQRALEKDPSYALAYVGIAGCYIRFGLLAFLPPKVTFPKAKVAVEKALEIDSTVGEVHSCLASIKWDFDWDWEGAEREFKRALELNPGYAQAHLSYAMYLSTMGRSDEAIIELKQAQEIDPLSLFIKITGGCIFYFAGQYDESVEQFRKALEMDPNYIAAYIFLGQTYIAKEMYEEAIATCQKAVTLSEGSPLDTPALGWLGWAYAYSGQRDKSLKILDRLDELSKKKYVSPVYSAIIYIGLGDKDQAFKYFEKAYLERTVYLVYIKVQPICDPLRSDPRFKALLKKMNLE